MNPDKPKSDAHQPANILAVDDTPANLQMLAAMLKDRRHQVRPVPSGKLTLLAAFWTQQEGYTQLRAFRMAARTDFVTILSTEQAATFRTRREHDECQPRAKARTPLACTNNSLAAGFGAYFY